MEIRLPHRFAFKKQPERREQLINLLASYDVLGGVGHFFEGKQSVMRRNWLNQPYHPVRTDENPLVLSFGSRCLIFGVHYAIE